MLQERGHGSLQIIKWRVYSSQTEDVVEIAVTMLNYFPWLLVAAALLLSVIFLKELSEKLMQKEEGKQDWNLVSQEYPSYTWKNWESS